MKLLAGILTVLGIAFSYTAHATSAQGYVDKDLNPLPEYASILNEISAQFGKATPEVVKLEIIETNGNSSFDPYLSPQTVFISRRWFSGGDLKRLTAAIAHETTHLAIFNLTQNGEKHGASIFNEFRFIDEGMAELVGRRVGGFGPPKWDKVKAANQSGKIDFTQASNWRNEPPYQGAPGRFNTALPSYFSYEFSYAVGASFISFLESIRGLDGVKEFLRSLGIHRELETSLKEVYGLSLSDTEIAWKAFIDKL
jgi:hypothetical protein